MRLLAALRKEGRFDSALLLFLMSGYCFALSLFRYWLTGSRLFLFLNWNLFLAVIPWAAATTVELRPKLRSSRPALAGGHWRSVRQSFCAFPDLGLHHTNGKPAQYDVLDLETDAGALAQRRHGLPHRFRRLRQHRIIVRCR
jgi:hypothetical protein